MWSIDLSVSTTELSLVKFLPYLILSDIFINILKQNFVLFFFYKGFSPFFKVVKIFTHLYTTSLSYIDNDVRLACVKHLDSVQSEPSSNSIFISEKIYKIFSLLLLLSF
ncbi:hypothetical protein D8B26_M00120 (mitochondrion) [Coccidioides posadasii str. Silveira]|uniref:uncharacterized protein n=1 Tax=Coccidioides posadasii (strain RMSCC 757 / Silveira) TaxID=443226 RepID=UPI001024A282|nr:hypothetical protein D8B26_M00120 [Coccidioides posadasii str. Silveira]